MSKRLQHILTELEMAPPQGVWERIVPELDEMEALKSVAGRLRQAEETPPSAAWETIREQLNELSIGKKLQDLELPAPAAVWPQVAGALDRTEEPTRRLPLLRYAAAAILAGALIWAGIRFLGGNPSPNEPLASRTDTPAVQIDEEQARQNLAAILADTRPVADALEEARNDAALEGSKKSVARVDLSDIKRKLNKVSAYSFGQPGAEPLPPVINSVNDDRYMLMATCDGQVVRLSKKLIDISCCLTGENRSPECMEQLRAWQERIIQAKGSHAPGNFTDFLDIIKALRENR